ncbi:hypothetical protein GCM10012284_40490 [Mangrovihabitans endophyticus]|uniref:NADP-dependent oxidoreductase domain-containing protein n=2 Tax=Mangrovihabitans endophyticus TaxID=1751298 RepID=A0A8J3C0N3_9ACTN|nr:hypothetical protein GCM10012284_40490 [Mangrovihabitans endophyticus]
MTTQTETEMWLPIRDVPGLPRPIPAIGAGCWTIGGPAANQGTPIGWDDVNPDDALAGLHAAYDLGVRLFDTADVYGMGRSEQLLGQFVSQVSRAGLVLTSKVGYQPGPDGGHPYAPNQIRRQFEHTLTHLNTDYLDVYFLHSGDFGPEDRYLQPAVDTLQDLLRQGAIKAIGLRAPHEFAVEWADRDGLIAAQAARFLHLFQTVHPEILTVRHNLLSHQVSEGETDVFAFARQRGTGVLIKQALGQGVLLGTHDPASPRRFSALDHRSRDPLFAPAILHAVRHGLRNAGVAAGDVPGLEIRAALGFALRQQDAAVLVGFRDAAQITATITAARSPIHPADLDLVHRALQPARDLLHHLPPPIRQTDK